MSVRTGFPVIQNPNVTPLIDVMLVLLIIFMIVTPLIEAGVVIQLPTAGHFDPDRVEHPLTVTVTSEGKMLFRRLPVSEQALQDAVSVYLHSSPDVPILIEADRRTRYQDVERAWHAIQAGGGINVALVAVASQ